MAHPAPKIHAPEPRPEHRPANYALLLERILDDSTTDPRGYARLTTVEGGAE